MPAEALSLVGRYSTAEDANAALELGAQCSHLVAPAPAVVWIPEGFEVQVIAIEFDGVLDCYQLDDERQGEDLVGLRREALWIIARAAGVSWEYSRRKDTERHPHYVEWEAALTFDRFDGTTARAIGTADIDTREPDYNFFPKPGTTTKPPHAGPAYLELLEACDADKRRDFSSELTRLRRFQVRACETQAMNKAIAGIGVRRRYRRAELARPFLVARLVFTGRSSDAELARRFALLIADRHLNARGALYPKLEAVGT